MKQSKLPILSNLRFLRTSFLFIQTHFMLKFIIPHHSLTLLHLMQTLHANQAFISSTQDWLSHVNVNTKIP